MHGGRNMVKLEKNQEMRADILNTAKVLFYEYGYKDTLFVHIANELGITKGLITYYFGTKANLANEVYTQFEMEINNKINFMMYANHMQQYNYEPKLVIAVIQMTTLDMFHQDEKARRFFVEHMYENLQFGIEDTFIPFYMAQRRKGGREELKKYDYVKMVAFSQRAARASTSLAYFRDKINIPYEEFVDYSLSLHWKIEQMPETKIKEMLETAKMLYKSLQIQIKRRFEIVSGVDEL